MMYKSDLADNGKNSPYGLNEEPMKFEFITKGLWIKKSRLLKAIVPAFLLCFCNSNVLAASNSSLYETEASQTQTVKLKENKPQAKNRTVKCKVEFLPDQWDQDVSVVKDCFKDIPLDEISSVDVFTNPAPNPKKLKNTFLWEKRSHVLSKELSHLFPNKEIHARSAKGLDWLFRSSLIVVKLKNLEDKQQDQPEKEEKPKAQSRGPPPVHAHEDADSEEDHDAQVENDSQEDHDAHAEYHKRHDRRKHHAYHRAEPPAPASADNNRVCIVASGSCNNPATMLGLNCPIVIIASTGESCHNDHAPSLQAAPPPRNQYRTPTFEPAPQIQTAQLTCPVCETKFEKNYKNLPTRFWFGLEYIFPQGTFTTFGPSAIYGNTFGLSQSITHLDTSNDLYVAVAADFGNGYKVIPVGTTKIIGYYYLVNMQFQVGVEHFFSNTSYSAYADIGAALQQRSFLVVNSLGGVNNYAVYTTQALSMNLGVIYDYKVNQSYGIFSRLNVSGMAGMSKNLSVLNSVGTVLGNIDTNPILITPSISLGLSF